MQGQKSMKSVQWVPEQSIVERICGTNKCWVSNDREAVMDEETSNSDGDEITSRERVKHGGEWVSEWVSE